LYRTITDPDDETGLAALTASSRCTGRGIVSVGTKADEPRCSAFDEDSLRHR
jgi:hypothetical protein